MLRELADHGTVAAVADVLSMTPSAVSQQLKTLQREAGLPLIEPAGRRVLPSCSYGRSFVTPPKASAQRATDDAATLLTRAPLFACPAPMIVGVTCTILVTPAACVAVSMSSTENGAPWLNPFGSQGRSGLDGSQ